MKLFCAILFGLILLCGSVVKAEKKSEIDNYIAVCKRDLEFLRTSMQKNSAAYANKSDSLFQKWFKEGYEDTLKLIEGIGDRDDCYYAIKYYINGFNQPHISIRGYIPLPMERYPGLLSVKEGKNYLVIYKHHALEYLKDVSVGDKITHINDIKIADYYKDYVLPFYANDYSELTLESASIYTLILDGNRFKPIARTITVAHEDKSVKVEL